MWGCEGKETELRGGDSQGQSQQHTLQVLQVFLALGIVLMMSPAAGSDK